MLFSCLPAEARIPGRFPGPPHPRGKHFTVDIHCHLLTEDGRGDVPSAGAVDRRPREVFANARTREVNREQAERTRVQFTSVEKRLADMDLMGIDIQAITPAPNQTYYDTPPDLGIATARAINDNIADIVGAPSGSLRRARHGAVPGAGAGGGGTRAAASDRSACAASRSPPTSPATICRPTVSARSSPRRRSLG